MSAPVQPVVHTPGPWTQTQNAKTGVKIWGADHKPVAIIVGGIERSMVTEDQPKPEWQSNADLIRCSPQLLASLRDAVRLIRHLGGNAGCQEKAIYDATGEVV